jgi:hypothetical protein
LGAAADADADADADGLRASCILSQRGRALVIGRLALFRRNSGLSGGAPCSGTESDRAREMERGREGERRQEGVVTRLLACCVVVLAPLSIGGKQGVER